ncbi:MAG: hypothetical protein LBC73_06985 [Oscillospiraceae bacterium]|jgi:hypothetical protein|nr:hypothetical protein [Oscillospiraceae bacterium]
MLVSKKVLFLCTIIITIVMLTGCGRRINPDVIEIFEEAYRQSTFAEFTEGMSRYRMVVLLGVTEVELLLRYVDDAWTGTLKHSELDKPYEERIVESLVAEISGDYLVIYSEPESMIPLADFFFNRFEPAFFVIERAGYGTFEDRQTAIANGIYDLDYSVEFMELFYNNFISVLSNFEEKDRYFYSLNKIYFSKFNGWYHGLEGFSFQMLFNEESERRAHRWSVDAEMVFYEVLQRR